MKKDETLESILKMVEEPRVEVFLDKELREFLKFYNKNRDIYDIRSFGENETKTLRKLLDGLVTSYILKHEHAGYKLSLYSKQILEHRQKIEGKWKELTEYKKTNEEQRES